jgi:exosortase/archaeosortase family protein
MSRLTRDTARALLVFLLVLGLFSWAYYRDAAPPWLLWMTDVLARSSSSVLDAVGVATAVVERPQEGSRLPSYLVVGERARVDIAIDCNGAWAFAIFVAAVLAMPGCGWRARAWGIGLGVPALWIVNTIRVVSLYFVAVYIPSVFEELHLYVWQFLIIAAALGLLLLWAEYFVRPADA